MNLFIADTHFYHKNIIEYPPESYSVKKHICVSAEMINYTPISVEEINSKSGI